MNHGVNYNEIWKIIMEVIVSPSLNLDSKTEGAKMCPFVKIYTLLSPSMYTHLDIKKILMFNHE